MIDLPMEKLADAVVALRHEVWARPEAERRALPRIRIWAPRAIQLAGAANLAAAEPLEVWLVDLACGGVGFLSPRPLDIGRDFKLSLPMMDAPPVNLLCRVLHCQAAPNGVFTIGARFVQELEPRVSTNSGDAAGEPSAAETPVELRRAS